MPDKPVVVVGAGLVGSMAGLMLAQRGYHVHIFEGRQDYRKPASDDNSNSSLHGQLTNTTKRSINLALSHRGLCALRAVGLESEVLKNSVPMEGRMIHPMGETDINKTVFQPYEHRCRP
jgi:kynurenine 3-monooxygenase